MKNIEDKATGAVQTELPERGHDHVRTTPGAAVMACLASLLWIVQAWLIAAAVNCIALREDIDQLGLIAAGYLLAGCCRATLDAGCAWRQFRSARASVTGLRRGALRALAVRSPLERTRLPSGEVAHVLAEQAETVLPWLLRQGPVRWRALLVPPVILVCVIYFSWLASLILLATAPIIPLFMAIIGARAQQASAAQLKVAGGMNGFLLDRLRGVATLRAFGAVEITARRMRVTAASVRASTMAVLRIACLSSTALELFSALGVALTATYVGFYLLGEFHVGSWNRSMTLQQGLFILLLAPAFYEPLRDIAALWHDRAAGRAAREALERLAQVGLALPGGETSPAPLSRALALAAGTAPLAVDIERLRFAYPGEADLFGTLDLYVAPGEHVALVGPSGAGKSTLLAIMAGLVPPSAGTIEVGEVALVGDDAAAVRSRIAWIGQQPYVFAASVQTNITLGRPGLSVDDVDAAIALVGLDRVHHARAADRLGEGGAGLSGGELARLGLARAALTPHAGLLLADEPGAHLDRHSALEVIDTLLALARGRTLIVATHDSTLAARMDRVIDLGAMDDVRMVA